MICTASTTENSAIEARLLHLALVSSNKPAAVSVYFQTRPCEAKSDAIHLKELVRDLATEAQHNGELHAWTRIAGKMEDWLKPEAGLHALFVCPQQAVWEEFELPAHTGPDSVHIDKVFHVVPLLRSLQHPASVLVVLVERERARICYVKHGFAADQVENLRARPSQICTHDNRTGWSSHIEKHKEHHASQFLERVIEEAGQVSGEPPVIIGCRYEVWSELHSQIPAALENRIIGRFVPMSLEVGDEELLEKVKYVLREHESERQKAVLQNIRENKGTMVAAGLQQATAALSKGSVKELLLGASSSVSLYRCTECGRLNVEPKACLDCRATFLQTMDSEEALAREALSQGAKITFIENHGLEEFEGVAALLRFRS